MSDMRLRARSFLLLAGLLLLSLPSAAAAEPHPIAKPNRIAPIQPVKPAHSSTPPASSNSSSASSSTPPPASPPPAPPTQRSASPSSAAGSRTRAPVRTQLPLKQQVVVIDALGGRDQSGIAVPAPPPPEPTPLGLVRATDRVTAPAASTPAWKIALLALLAAGEAFLVVRLVRNRPGELSPA
jgi:cytoskeletal protein RodZ